MIINNDKIMLTGAAPIVADHISKSISDLVFTNAVINDDCTVNFSVAYDVLAAMYDFGIRDENGVGVKCRIKLPNIENKCEFITRLIHNLAFNYVNIRIK